VAEIISASEIFADAIGHEFTFFHSTSSALGIARGASDWEHRRQRLEVLFAWGGLRREYGAQQAMHHESGIAADGRGEVGKWARRSAKVWAAFVRAGSGLAEGAEHQ
jgi:hypothetical protein